jgi:light-regulated signal transduction histidine kinase (bacteriophytochrome)
LEDSNKNLKAFACVASHDLQAPLRQIRTLCELLEDHARDNLDEHARTLVGHISGCAYRLSTLVDSLLAHSRIDATLPTYEPVDCSELLACILQDFKTPIHENHAVVTHDVLPTIQADRIQLRQLLQNLVGNALKYCDDRTPVVHVGVESRSCEWLFSVRDNGIGIESRHFDQIFVMFTRLHADESYPGTGVGLATCKRIVERHGGRIWVESQPNEGSVFYFTLPRL